jgi:hypothetical protein
VDDNDENYPCFNAFFYRKLKPDARPIDFPVCPSVLLNDLFGNQKLRFFWVLMGKLISA